MTDREQLRKAAEEVSPSAFLDYRIFLKNLYANLKVGLGAYSWQRFAEDLGFSASTIVHQFAQGYRPLSAKSAERLAKALSLKGTERRYFLALVGYCNARQSSRRAELFNKLLAIKSETLPTDLDRDQLEYFSEWFHPVVFELVGTKSFLADPAWIAGRIVPHLRPEQARGSLELLLRMGLIRMDAATGRYVQTNTRISTGHRVEGMALARYHQGMIEHAREAVTRLSGERRDVSALTVNVDEATAQRLRAMIHAFQLQLLDEAEKADAADQVYQINIQIFPFTE